MRRDEAVDLLNVGLWLPPLCGGDHPHKLEERLNVLSTGVAQKGGALGGMRGGGASYPG